MTPTPRLEGWLRTTSSSRGRICFSHCRASDNIASGSQPTSRKWSCKSNYLQKIETHCGTCGAKIAATTDLRRSSKRALRSTTGAGSRRNEATTDVPTTFDNNHRWYKRPDLDSWPTEPVKATEEESSAEEKTHHITISFHFTNNRRLKLAEGKM